MTVSVWAQARCILGALGLGCGIGLVYDLLRCLRWRLPRGILSGLLDLLFWLTATAVLFLWSIAAGGGVVRLSTCLWLFLGGAGYFRLLSPLLLPLLGGCVRLLAKLARLIFAPARLCARGGALAAKKILFFSKKAFSFLRKYAIM